MVRRTRVSSSRRFIRRFIYAFFLLLFVLILSCVHDQKNVIEEPIVGQIRTCDVSRVLDGDTLWVVCDGERVKLRVYCIDAPELAQKPWGLRSKKYLSILAGKQLHVEYRDTDQYGRTVARLRRGDTDIGGQMILEGHAVVYTKYCPSTEGGYSANEATAKRRQKEVWSQPGLQSIPWVWRHKQ